VVTGGAAIAAAMVLAAFASTAAGGRGRRLRELQFRAARHDRVVQPSRAPWW